MIIEWSISMPSNHSAEASGEIEIDDDATEEEIEEAVRQEVFEYIEWGYNIKTQGGE